MIRLYSYWRSSAAHRVRIALNLKGLDYEIVPVHLLEDGGRQHAPGYARLNPQHLVPTLEQDDFTLGQSLAILQYLEAIAPQPPLVPADHRAAAHMWQICQLIACDIHPLNNLRVLQYLEREYGVEPRARWYPHWIELGFEALETLLEFQPRSDFCCGQAPTLADACLVPQVANARRVNLNLTPYPRIVAIDARCGELEAFARAAPAAQPDAPRT